MNPLAKFHWRVQLIIAGLFALAVAALLVTEILVMYRLGAVEATVPLILSLVAVGLLVVVALLLLNTVRSQKLQIATDPKTGTLSEIEFHSYLNQEWKRSIRFSHHFGLVVCDVDRFKEINDSFGHHCGDLVLRDVAGLLEDTIRPNLDRLSRRGTASDEFMLLLPETSHSGALRLTARLKRRIARHRFIFEGRRIPLSLSLGIAIYPEDGATTRRLNQTADEAMYREKKRRKARRGRS